MNPSKVTVSVPATSANLGPGFDCLAMALDLWNTCTFSVGTGGFRVLVTGEGAGSLPVDSHNLIAWAFFEVYRRQGNLLPTGVKIECDNCIPLGSGLGSSAAALLAGIAGANALLGEPLTKLDILTLAAELEGHADNAAAALFGGLTMATTATDGSLIVHPLPCSLWDVVVVMPDFKLPTYQSRQALPERMPLHDSIFNVGHAILTAEALRTGDRVLLSQALQDRLHQPYRLKLIPGAQGAIQAAEALGAPAALSGAGPSIIAFPDQNYAVVQSAMQAEFLEAGLKSRAWNLETSFDGLSCKVT